MQNITNEQIWIQVTYIQDFGGVEEGFFLYKYAVTVHWIFAIFIIYIWIFSNNEYIYIKKGKKDEIYCQGLTVAVETSCLFAFSNVIGAQHQKNVVGREKIAQATVTTSPP